MNTSRKLFFPNKLAYILLLFLLIGCSSIFPASQSFDGERALMDITTQVNFGPRTPGSIAHKAAIDYIQNELIKSGWDVSILAQEINSKTAYNILATKNNQADLMLGAHYDSRISADNDPIKSNQGLAVPGANDGASGVAVLLEIARVLPASKTGVALLFIDIEDNGRIPGWDWILGSRAFTNEAKILPKIFILLDMIGDKDLSIFMERNSDPVITNQIWSSAKKLGYEKYFNPTYKYQVLDDHMPFIEKGVRSVDIIDLDYKYWHTTEDTADKVSPVSLKIVGDTIIEWIMNNTVNR